MTSALTTFRPASIIVANWREKICSDFGLIFLNAVRADSSPADGQLVEPGREQAADAQLLARRVRIGRVDLAERLDAERVDRAVGVRRHTLCAIGRRPWPLEAREAQPVDWSNDDDQPRERPSRSAPRRTTTVTRFTRAAVRSAC